MSRPTPLIAALLLGIAASGFATRPAVAAEYRAHLDIPYAAQPAHASPLKTLDLYEPRRAGGRRPVAVWVHGGGWMRGDKRNRIVNKANVFTANGFLLASLNYRLSPDPPRPSDPSRVRFPDHPHDIAEAIAWLSRNAARHGGDPDRLLLVGHSAGAHLVSLLGTDPRYLRLRGLRFRQLVGIASLDTAAFDIPTRADPARSTLGLQGLVLLWNAFGTPDEDRVGGSWAAASPLRHADPGDPPFLLVTQRRNPVRQAENRAMAEALGGDPGDVLIVDADHERINTALGAPDDTTGVTPAVLGFAERVTHRPRVRITKRPGRRVRATGKRARVRFRFRADLARAQFECRLDRRRWRRCRAPTRYRLKRGKHVFRVRAVNGPLRGRTASLRFRVRG